MRAGPRRFPGYRVGYAHGRSKKAFFGAHEYRAQYRDNWRHRNDVDPSAVMDGTMCVVRTAGLLPLNVHHIGTLPLVALCGRKIMPQERPC